MTSRAKEWARALHRLASTVTAPDPVSMPRPMYGTVRSLVPLRIALDSDPAFTLPYTPACLQTPTLVGQRVWAVTYGREVVVVGLVGGALPEPPTPDTGWTPVSLNGGFSGTLAYRIRGSLISIRGAVTGTFVNGTTAVGTVPSGAIPSVQVPMSVASFPPAINALIRVTGVIDVLTTSAGAGTYNLAATYLAG